MNYSICNSRFSMIYVGNNCKVSNIDRDLIKTVKIFDVYEGENIPENKKSIALNVTIQSSEKTLNDEDLEKVNQLIISTVEKKSGAKIRS